MGPPLYRPRRGLPALQRPAATIVVAVVAVTVVIRLGHVEGLVAVVQGRHCRAVAALRHRGTEITLKLEIHCSGAQFDCAAKNLAENLAEF